MGDPKALVAGITGAQADGGTFLWPTDDISDDGRFMVVVRAGIELTLHVNDVPVPGTKIGERIENRREGAQIVAWYGVRLEPGENRVEVRGKDPFGNARVLAGADVRRPAGAARLLLRATTDELPADGGRSSLPVELLLVDADGTPVSGVSFVTLASSRGRFVGDDLRANEPGHQVRVENGRAKVAPHSSERAGRFRLDARAGDLVAGLNLVQIASGRPLIAVGSIDAGVTLPLGDGETRTDDDIELDSRAAIFLKGAVAGKAQLTLAYDTDRARDSALLGDPVTDDIGIYPVTGDRPARLRGAQQEPALRAHRARPQQPDVGRLPDRRAHRARRSRARAAHPDRYQRGLGHGRDARAGLRGRAVRGTSRRALPGQRHGHAVRVRGRAHRAEQRGHRAHRHQPREPGLEISAERLVPGLDYRLDPVTGQLAFADPVPSADADLNPVSIRASYDVDTGGDADEHLIAGARIERGFGERLTLGASITDDADPLAGATLASVQGRATLDGRFGATVLAASGATMRHVDGRDGAAARFGIEHAWGEAGVHLTSLTWARAGTDFDNPSAGISAGRTEWRLDHRQRLGTATSLLVEALESASGGGDEVAAERYRSAALIGERDLGRWSARLGVRRIDSSAGEETLGLNTALVGLERRFAFGDGRPASLGIEHERGLGDAARQRSAVSARIGLHERVTGYARWEREQGLSTRSLLGLAGASEQLVAGVESDWLAHTELFSEYRMRGAFDGRALENASGVRGRYELAEGLSITPSFEYIDALNGPAEDALALSIGIADVRGVRRRVTGQFEFRDTDSSRYFGVRASIAERLTRDWTGLVREEFTQSRPSSGEHTTRQRLTFGLARRPKHDHARHLLMLAEWKRDRGEIAGDDDDRFVLSAHSNVRPTTRWTLSNRVAGKLVRTDFGDRVGTSRAALVDARLSIDLARRWELDVLAGALATGVGADGFDAVDWAAGAGIAWLAERNLRLTLGWNAAGFSDADLDADGLLRQGLRAGLEFKFDEELFRWLEP